MLRGSCSSGLLFVWCGVVWYRMLRVNWIVNMQIPVLQFWISDPAYEQQIQIYVCQSDKEFCHICRRHKCGRLVSGLLSFSFFIEKKNTTTWHFIAGSEMTACHRVHVNLSRPFISFKYTRLQNSIFLLLVRSPVRSLGFTIFGEIFAYVTVF